MNLSLLGNNLHTYFQCPVGDVSDTVGEETDDLLGAIECLTSQVMRETRLWNLQIHAERGFEDNGEKLSGKQR
jgi:hypothetical protein